MIKLKLGGKKTALETAMERSRGRGMDVRRLGITILIGVLVAIATACILQASAVWRENTSAALVEQQRAWGAAEASKFIAASQERVKQALDDNEIRLALATVDEAARMRAEIRLKQRLTDLITAEFYAPELTELTRGDLGKFGYVRADALARARSSKTGIAPVTVDRDSRGNWALAFAQVVRGGDRVYGYVYLLLPLDPLNEVLSQARVSNAYVDLRQAALTGMGVTLFRFPGAEGGGAPEDRSVEVKDSTLSIAGRAVNAFKIGEIVSLVNSRSVAALVTSALLLIAIAGAGYWYMRRFSAGGPREAPMAEGEIMPAMVQRAPTAHAAPRPERAAAAEGGDAAPRAPRPAAPMVLDRSIFRAYDIRGVVGKSLTNEVAAAIGQAVGSLAKERGLTEIVVGRDGRHSGPELAKALIEGLKSSGCDVIDIGAVPTPILYFATYHLNTGSGVMVTGSHNPPEYNGFKIMVGGETLAEDAIQDLYARIAEGRLETGTGSSRNMLVAPDYLERITGDIQVERQLKIVVDAGNGIAGNIAPQVLEGIGCEIVPLYCDVDGDFPHHHPDPSDPHNLADLMVAVKQFNADIGLAFDGDGDRLGVVTAAGDIVWPDRLLMLFAQDVLLRNPGAAVIYDVKCSGKLQDIILSAGGSPIMWKTGHSLIKAKMRETDAELAGEMSGHFFFRERWFGFDDAIYAAARLAEILAVSPLTAEEVFAELPKSVSTPEIKVPMEEGRHYAFISKFRELAQFPGARVTTIDGVRADYPHGWGLVRPSNTTPVLVLRFEADDNPALHRIQEEFKRQLLALEPALALPF